MKTFKIYPYPKCINFSAEEKEILTVEARLYQLTDIDKRKVKCCIEVATLTGGLAVFPIGFYCHSLKKYIEELGYKYSGCGNSLDLVIKL